MEGGLRVSSNPAIEQGANGGTDANGSVNSIRSFTDITLTATTLDGEGAGWFGGPARLVRRTLRRGDAGAGRVCSCIIHKPNVTGQRRYAFSELEKWIASGLKVISNGYSIV